MKGKGRSKMEKLNWWGKQFIIASLSIFFLLLGIDTLITAYHLNNPQMFIMYFFSSNFIILISAVGILSAVIKIHARLKEKNRGTE